jgi:hypothetical protein
MFLMSIIKKKIDNNIMTMSLILYSQYSCFILSIAIKKLIVDKAMSFAIFDFDFSEFLLAIHTFVFASMIIELLIIFDINLVIYAWIISSVYFAELDDYLKSLTESVVL